MTENPSPGPSAVPGQRYFERLWAPLSWWAIAVFLAFSFVVAVWAILSDAWALGALVVGMALVAALLLGVGRAGISVDEDGLRAGGAFIEWRWLAGAAVLDAAATRELVGGAADGRTWLLVRPWLKSSVLVDLTDRADPHRHWVLSSRHPAALAEAINAQVASRGNQQEALHA